MAIGLTSESQSYIELIAGAVKEFYCLVDSLATVAVGQVFQWDAGGNNFIDYTSGSGANAYAICAEAKTIGTDTRVRCIVCGEINKNALNDVAQLDPEIEAALLRMCIIPLTTQGTAAAEAS